MLDDDDALGVDPDALALVSAPRKPLPPSVKSPLSPSTLVQPSSKAATPALSSPQKKDARPPPVAEPILTPKRQRTIVESFHPSTTRDSASPPGDITTRELSQRLSPVKKDAPLAHRPLQLTDDDFQREGPWLTMCAERGLPPFAALEGALGPLSCHIQFIQSGGVAVRQKVPELAVHVKSVAQQGLDAAVTVQDPTGEMEGTVHADVLSKHKGQVVPGAVILLREVPLYIPTGHEVFLIITLANVTALYPPWTPKPEALVAGAKLPWQSHYLQPAHMQQLHQRRLERGLLASPTQKASTKALRPAPAAPRPTSTPKQTKRTQRPAPQQKKPAAAVATTSTNGGATVSGAQVGITWAGDDAIDEYLSSLPPDQVL